MSPEESVSKELLDSIRKLVQNGKTDLQIAIRLKLNVPEVYRIRKRVLGISFYGKQRRCTKCKEKKVTTCFNKDSKHPDWCKKCRYKFGGEKPPQKPVRLPGQESTQKYTEEICLRCDKVFLSEIFIGYGGRETHYRLCEKHRGILPEKEE